MKLMITQTGDIGNEEKDVNMSVDIRHVQEKSFRF